MNLLSLLFLYANSAGGRALAKDTEKVTSSESVFEIKNSRLKTLFAIGFQPVSQSLSLSLLELTEQTIVGPGEPGVRFAAHDRLQ